MLSEEGQGLSSQCLDGYYCPPGSLVRWECAQVCEGGGVWCGGGPFPGARPGSRPPGGGSFIKSKQREREGSLLFLPSTPLEFAVTTNTNEAAAAPPHKPQHSQRRNLQRWHWDQPEISCGFGVRWREVKSWPCCSLTV